VIEDLLIVAAGMGTRLRSKSELKPLTRLGGMSLIERAIMSAFKGGMHRATIVTGYCADVLEDHLQGLRDKHGWDIRTVFNPDYTLPNGLSVLKAKEALTGPFCLTMCDHFVDPVLYTRLLAAERGADTVALAVDTRLDNPLVDLEDVTRVMLDGRYIRAIGKEMEPYHAFDTGVFAAGPALFEALEQSGRELDDFSISGGMRILSREDRALGIDIGDACWIDVDSPDMLELAEDWLEKHPGA